MPKRIYTNNPDTSRDETQIWAVVGMSKHEVESLEFHATKEKKSLSQFLGPLMLLAAVTFLEENPLPEEAQRQKLETEKVNPTNPNTDPHALAKQLSQPPKVEAKITTAEPKQKSSPESVDGTEGPAESQASKRSRAEAKARRFEGPDEASSLSSLIVQFNDRPLRRKTAA